MYLILCLILSLMISGRHSICHFVFGSCCVRHFVFDFLVCRKYWLHVFVVGPSCLLVRQLFWKGELETKLEVKLEARTRDEIGSERQ